MHTCSPAGRCTCLFDPAFITPTLLAAFTAEALPAGAPPVTPDEAWLLLRLSPHVWPQWLDLYRADDRDGDDCARLAVLLATSSPADRAAAYAALLPDITPEGTK